MTDVTPANALDPNVVLATSVHAQPGVYALLLGSGVSTGAGVLTGWGIIRDLVRRTAAAHAPEDDVAPEKAFEDPETWWAANGDGQPLGYSNLLAAMDSTPAARRNQIARYFEPNEHDLETGQKTPSAAHRAVADLVKRGSVRVIVTTNFDRLIERALEDVGISPQVIRNPSDVAGMSPLPHAPATVIKLHGDYADLLMRNTVDELDTYPDEWNYLLDRIFDEYGLIVSGWSADWDTALVAAHRRARSRRYPLFWDSRSSKGEAARELVAFQRGTVVAAADADTFFRDLVRRLDALDRLAEPPITSAIAIQRLKRDLLNPVRRINVHDLVMGELIRVVDFGATMPPNVNGLTAARYMEEATATVAKTVPLLRLIASGVQHDHDGLHDDLWVDVLQRLLRLDKIPDGTGYQDLLKKLRLLPAVLVLRTAGIAAIQTKRERLFLRLCSEPGQPNTYKPSEWWSAGYLLSDYEVLKADAINQAHEGNGWLYPPSHFLREQMHDLLPELLPTEDEYQEAQSIFEFRLALYQFLTSGWATPGEFLINAGYFGPQDFPLLRDFQNYSNSASSDWAWWNYLGSREALDDQLTKFFEQLKQVRRLR